MAKSNSISDVLAEVRKKYDVKIGPASEVVEPTRWLSTGNLGIDYVSGHGVPLGRTVELYGQPSSGKTTTALQTAAALQQRIKADRLNEHIVYLDYEHAIDPDYCAALGLDVEDPSFLLVQPHSLEQGAEAALKMIDTGLVRLSIWDSVAAMAPIARLEGEFDQRTAAMNKARLMSGLMLQLTPLLHKHASTAVFINHLMESVEMHGKPGMPIKTTTPGGKALKFYASLRLEFRQMGAVKVRGADVLTGEPGLQATATQVKVKCVKNKVASPFREAEVRITHGRGFDNVWSAVQVLLAYKVIRKDGAWYRFDITSGLTHPAMTVPAGKSRPSILGEPGVLRFAAEHPDWASQVTARAVELVDEHGGDAIDTGTGEPADPLAEVDLTDLGATPEAILED